MRAPAPQPALFPAQQPHYVRAKAASHAAQWPHCVRITSVHAPALLAAVLLHYVRTRPARCPCHSNATSRLRALHHPHARAAPAKGPHALRAITVPRAGQNKARQTRTHRGARRIAPAPLARSACTARFATAALARPPPLVPRKVRIRPAQHPRCAPPAPSPYLNQGPIALSHVETARLPRIWLRTSPARATRCIRHSHKACAKTR